MKSVINNKLAECLVAKGINQSQLARRFDLSRAHVSRLVNGAGQPSLDLALRMAGYFKKPVEQIFQLADECQQNISPASLGSAGKLTINNTETTKGKSK